MCGSPAARRTAGAPARGVRPATAPLDRVPGAPGLVDGSRAMFVVVGEALVDLVGQRGSRTLVAHPGGSPANVALGLARLGDPVTLVTRLGRDGFGEMVSAHLKASGVRVDVG